MTARLSLAALAAVGLLFLAHLIGPAAPAPDDKPKSPLAYRNSPTAVAKLVKERGGNAASEAAVARGLVWLARKQSKDGSWKSDGDHKDDLAPTGLALLAFLGAGESHTGQGKYAATVRGGLASVLNHQREDGGFAGASTMYTHAIATVALCEAYGLSADAKLEKPARKALDYIIDGQSDNGSWGYKVGTRGDTSIMGWQVQALHAGRAAGLLVPDKILTNAEKFLDSVMDNQGGYGYTTKGGTPNLTAVGAYCRVVNGAKPDDASLVKSLDYLKRTAEPGKSKASAYCFYYATRALADVGGDAWDAWNPKMRDLLVAKQEKADSPEAGSWDDKGEVSFGMNAGRTINTAICVLTLEVYYRYPPPARDR